jgi:hypothetical protein
MNGLVFRVQISFYFGPRSPEARRCRFMSQDINSAGLAPLQIRIHIINLYFMVNIHIFFNSYTRLFYGTLSYFKIVRNIKYHMS